MNKHCDICQESFNAMILERLNFGSDWEACPSCRVKDEDEYKKWK
jgi:hypothetical protein